MSTYYVGWDVGAWHCDYKKKSQDALYISNKLFKQLCIRDQLNQETIEDFLNKCFDNTTNFTNEDTFYFAIDAVFSWPQAILNLLNEAISKEAIPEKFSTNPFLFRYTEQVISLKLNKQPQSVVQNQIGSQSTKIIYFLKKYNFQRIDLGVWKKKDREIYAIETYPALLDNHDNNTLILPNQDLKDAQKCQNLAQMFETTRCKLMSPSEYIEENPTTEDTDLLKQRIYSEGWIWLPKNLWPNKNKAK